MATHVHDQSALAALLIDTLPAAVIALTLDGEVVFWNQRAEMIFDLDHAGSLNKSFLDCVASWGLGAQESFARALEQVAEVGTATVQVELQRSDAPTDHYIASLKMTREPEGATRLIAVHMAAIIAPFPPTESSGDSRLRGLLEASPDAMIVADQQGRILLLNGQAQRLFGYKVQELLGQPLDLLVPKRFRPNHEDHRAHYFSNPRTRLMGPSAELYGLRKDGTEFPAEISLASLDAEGGTTVIAAVRDGTQRKRAEEKLAHLAALVNSSTDGIIGKTLDGTITSWNLGAERIFGYKAEEVIGHSSQLLVPPERAKEERVLLEQIGRGESIQQFNTLRKRKDGTDIHVAVTISPINDARGQVLGACNIVRDITDRRRAEEILRKSKEETEASNRDLEAFSYSVAHDLRAPLRAIEGFSRVLLKDYESTLETNAKHYLQRVHRSAISMAQLIDDLLLLARVTRSDMRSREVDLCRLAQAELERLRESQPDRNVEFLGTPSIIVGDEGLLGILMDNLVSNAWKFSGKRDRARIEVGSVVQQGEQVFYVRDNGAGFEMQYADKLFTPFQRLHRQDEFPGTGIGLATAERIVRRHGGRIWAAAVVEQGATFFFTIPAKTSVLQ